MAAHQSTAKQHRGAGASVAPDAAPIRGRLEDHIRALRLVLDILIVCDSALRLQGAEQDQEIAEVLRYCGSARLQGAIEEVEGVIGSGRQQGV